VRFAGWHRWRLGRFEFHWCLTDRRHRQPHLARTGFAVGPLLVSLWRYVGDDPRPNVTLFKSGWWGDSMVHPVQMDGPS
jgi:hypothetical protein